VLHRSEKLASAKVLSRVLLLKLVVMGSAASGLPVPVSERGAGRPSRIPVADPLTATWTRLQLLPPCGLLVSGSAIPCEPNRVGMEALRALNVASVPSPPRARRNDHFKTQGGFVSLDVLASAHLRSGPEFTWATPDSPREDLMKLRLLAPGWGVRYAWDNAPLAVGVSTCSRFMMMGREVPWFDALTSEARVELILP
jgi:hypothetical protein